MRGLAISPVLFVAMAGAVHPVFAQSVHRQKVTIEVGKNVQISASRKALPHYESLAAGDLRHDGRAISCVMVMTRRELVREEDLGYWNASKSDQQCYTTFDGGKTWEATLNVGEAVDPTVAYGRGDTVYVAALTHFDKTKADTNVLRTRVYRSVDGGRTWAPSSDFPMIDREYLAVDQSKGTYGGRVYLVGQGDIEGASGSEAGDGLQLFRSSDGGKTFQGPVHAAYPAGSKMFLVGTCVVLSDGTFVAEFGYTKPGRGQGMEIEPTMGPNAELHVISSNDGGESFGKSVKIADVRLDRPRSQGGIEGQLAVDPGSAAFKDRLYLAFPALVENRVQVHVTYSSDKGKTWSKPAIVNDDRTPEELGKRSDALLPAIAVNKDGVVLVTWYDRREASDNLGWRLRAAASLDGGETFSASVPVADAMNAYPANASWDVTSSILNSPKGGSINARIDEFYVSGGHTSGMAVDAAGTFIPTWLDNRTGVMQLWGAPVSVNGAVIKHGSADLASLEDLSKQVKFEVVRQSFERTSTNPSAGTLSMVVRLRNASKDTIVAPIKIRLRTLESQQGIPQVLRADNNERGTGAIWDFSGTLTGGILVPKTGSGERKLEFRIDDMRGLQAGRALRSQVLNADINVYGMLKRALTPASEK